MWDTIGIVDDMEYGWNSGLCEIWLEWWRMWSVIGMVEDVECDWNGG